MELSFERRIDAEPAPSVLDALVSGAWHGGWTVALGSVPAGLAYVLRWGWLDLPWPTLAAQLGTFVPVCGASYGAAIAIGQAWSKAERGLRAVALGALFGACGGLAPGAFAAEHFGRLPAPYFGTFSIFASAVLAFFLLGAALLRTEGASLARTLPALTLALLAPSFLCLVLWAVFPGTAWIADAAVIAIAGNAPSLGLFGALFGAFVGLLFGALLGFARAIVRRGAKRRL